MKTLSTTTPNTCLIWEVFFNLKFLPQLSNARENRVSLPNEYYWYNRMTERSEQSTVNLNLPRHFRLENRNEPPIHRWNRHPSGWVEDLDPGYFQADFSRHVDTNVSDTLMSYHVHYSKDYSPFSLQGLEIRRSESFTSTIPNPPLLELDTSIEAILPPSFEESFELLKHLRAQSIESHSLPPCPGGLRLPGVLALGGFDLQAAAATRIDRAIAALRVHSLRAARIAPAEAFGPHLSALSGAIPASASTAIAAGGLLRGLTHPRPSQAASILRPPPRMSEGRGEFLQPQRWRLCPGLLALPAAAERQLEQQPQMQQPR